MKPFVWVLLTPGLALLGEAARADSPEALADAARGVLQKHCASCHGGGKFSKGGFGFVLDRDRLLSRLLVVPGKASESDLYLRVQHGEMPPPSVKQRPSPAEVKALQRWIDAGAPPFERTVHAVKALSPRETAEAILADLQQLDPRRRRFTRYLTLTHLAAAGRSAKNLAVTREAVAKLLNSLSWHPQITLAEPVDPSATILRIDLRAYKWNASLWEKLVSANPYRLPANSEQSALRADWFVATASRPPLYHDLLQLPSSDRGVERLAQVDVPGNLEDDNVLRSGFNDSGVSKNNRLLERHTSAFGALWRSYDFASNLGRQNLFEHPLGPHTGATSFQPGGGEMIFHLPNGLQAYMLMDALGRRINKAPSEIVADPRRPDQRVETGISCFSCHARGLLFKADQLRPHVEKNAAVFGKAVLETVRALHPRKAKFQAQIDDDNVRYLKAMEKIGVRDPDQEPINLVTQRFEATLDATTAATELGVTLPELARFLMANAEHARIFGSLLTPGGTVQRQTFQEHFPELARRLPSAPASKPPVIAASFEGHTATVNCIVFAPDGETAASGSDDRTIRLWEIPSGKLLTCLDSSSAEIFALAYSTDGKYLLSAGRDRLVRLWDVAARKELRVFRGHTAPVRGVAFSADGKRAVSAGDDRSVRIWDTASGEETRALTGHTDAITSVVFSPDGMHVLSGSRDGTLRWWDIAAQKQSLRLEGHVGPVLSIALARDGATALSGGNDRTVRMWHLTAGKELACFKGHANAVIQVQFHRVGSEAFSSSSQHQGAEPTWRRWDLARHKEAAALSAGAEYRFGCAAFSADGRILVGGPAGFLKLWSW